jgi:hypothetical protein
MFKTIEPTDVSIKPFKVFKKFKVTDADSGSGVFGIQGQSSSVYAFEPGTSPSHSFATSNYPYSMSFYKYPTWYQVNHLYYRDYLNPYFSFGPNDTSTQKMKIHQTVNVITIPQALYGEKIKPNSVEVTDDSTSRTLVLKDDGKGNLYDESFSASFASDSPDTNNSGSVVGNVFYEHGIITITDTGSYESVGLGFGGDGYSVDFRGTHEIIEHEYVTTVLPGEFGSTTNISVSENRSGSITVLEGSPSMSNFFPPSDAPTGEGTGSYKLLYNATETAQNFVTHSDFAPYVTTVGLYDDNNQMLAVGKLSRAIKNEPELLLKLVVRFDL